MSDTFHDIWGLENGVKEARNPRIHSPLSGRTHYELSIIRIKYTTKYDILMEIQILIDSKSWLANT